MGTTANYNMAFFDFGDELDTSLNVQKEIDRFVLIDKQLFGLYNILGNGVVSGWDISDNGFSTNEGISVEISSGIGIVNFIAAQTTTTGNIRNLPPNSSFGIYAVLEGGTIRDRRISFNYSLVDISNNFAIQLARVVTGNASIISIDNDIRDLIGFEQIIKDEIDKHKHRGTPTKIDLREEVKNQLPGARIEGIDASKITTGVFEVDRIPSLDHNDLQNNGLLTHASLDTFVRGFSQNNKELFGEIASINMLKLLIFLKYKFTGDIVDEHFLNQLALIPGISPDSYIDFNASNANISLESGCISGKPVKIGRFESIFYDTQEAFINNTGEDNVVISDGTVTLANDLVITDMIEDFEGVSSPSQPIPGFTKSITVLDNSSNVISEGSDINKLDGFYSGKFISSITIRTVFTKLLSPIRDWDEFNELVFSVKSINSFHKEVLGYVTNINEDGTETQHNFVILSENEVTNNSDISKNNFVEKVIDVSSWDRKQIKEIVIYTDDTGTNFSFFLDDMFVRRRNLVVPEGFIRLSYSGGSDVVFYSVFFDTTIPTDTDIQVRIRVASSEGLLSRSSFSLPLNSGDVIALTGTNSEIEAKLITNDDSTTPTLNSIELRLLVDSEFNGFEISDIDDFSRGEFDNITIQSATIDDADLSITTPINIDGISFANKDIASEIDDENVGVFGISGINLPISPNQASNWINESSHRFNGLNSAVRRFNKNFIIADRKNHRVLEVDQNGKVVRGFGSTYMKNATNFYPLNSSYNNSNGVLSIVCTDAVTVNSISKISLFSSGEEYPLSSSDTIISTAKGTNKILEIELSVDNQSRLINITDNLFIDFKEGAFTKTIEKDDNANALFGTFGIVCSVAEFSYIDGIRSPIFVNILDSGNWIICNSTINFEDNIFADDFEEILDPVAGTIELDPENITIDYSSGDIIYSDFTLGSIIEVNNKFIVGGLFEDSEALESGVSGSDLLADITNPTSGDLFRASALDNLAHIRGGVFILEKPSTEAKKKYTSPDGLYVSSISMISNGNLLVSESSFIEPSGRIVTLDPSFNIISIIGQGNFNIINDVNSLSNGNIMISI